jgi:hypothetical protein
MRADKTGLNNFLKKIATVKLITNKNGFIMIPDTIIAFDSLNYSFFDHILHFLNSDDVQFYQRYFGRQFLAYDTKTMQLLNKNEVPAEINLYRKRIGMREL